MYVACSTQCFERRSLEDALRVIRELQFSKFDAAIHEHGHQLKPSQVVADIAGAASLLRDGPGLVPSAFSVSLDARPAEQEKQFRAICRLARITAVPLISVAASPLRTPFEAEVARLTRLVQLADAEGILLSVETQIGTHTETPDQAVRLCEQVAGLGLTLDPSHYTAGPHAGKGFDQVFPHVRHTHLRDTGRGPNQFQVRVGQGEVEYGRIVAQLARHRYERALTVDIRDVPDAPFVMEAEVRKLEYLLESLV